jgi:hypothetical protein
MEKPILVWNVLKAEQGIEVIFWNFSTKKNINYIFLKLMALFSQNFPFLILWHAKFCGQFWMRTQSRASNTSKCKLCQ